MQRRKKPFSSVSFSWLLPNLLTIGGLVSGLTGLRFALEDRWVAVIAMIALAAVFDGLDGRMARLLKTTSAFGAALDSLSDAVVFGIVPALCLYLWALQDSGNLAVARELFEEVLTARGSQLGPRHPDTLHSVGNVVDVLRMMGEREEATTVLGDAVAVA